MLRRTLLKVMPWLAFLGVSKATAASTGTVYRLNRFSVAGFQYYRGPELSDQLHPGTVLGLTTEPDNRYDPYAVRIDWQGNKLGYVPLSDNRHLSRLLRQGASLNCLVLENEAAGASWQALKIWVELEVG